MTYPFFDYTFSVPLNDPIGEHIMAIFKTNNLYGYTLSVDKYGVYYLKTLEPIKEFIADEIIAFIKKEGKRIIIN